jgi:hypothetical protein
VQGVENFLIKKMVERVGGERVHWPDFVKTSWMTHAVSAVGLFPRYTFLFFIPNYPVRQAVLHTLHHLVPKGVLHSLNPSLRQAELHSLHYPTHQAVVYTLHRSVQKAICISPLHSLSHNVQHVHHPYSTTQRSYTLCISCLMCLYGPST